MHSPALQQARLRPVLRSEHLEYVPYYATGIWRLWSAAVRSEHVDYGPYYAASMPIRAAVLRSEHVYGPFYYKQRAHALRAGR